MNFNQSAGLAAGASEVPSLDRGAGASSSERFAEAISTGYSLNISGKPFTVVTFSKADCGLKLPPDTHVEEAGKFNKLFETLAEIRPYVQRISERLNDPSDGATLRFASKLADRLDEFPLGVQKPMRDYLIAVLRNGSTLHYPRCSIIVPPISDQHLVSILKLNTPDLAEDADLQEFVKRAFDPIPFATRGYHLFKDSESEARFHRELITAYPELAAVADGIKTGFKNLQLRNIVDPAGTSAQADEYDRLSAQYCDKQRLFLEQKIKDAPDAQWLEALSTRVTVSVNESGDFSFYADHYSKVFRKDLDAVADIFERAGRYVPASAPDLPGILAAYERWARDESETPSWGESISEWLACDNSANILDVGLLAEEIGSLVGKKGDFQFSLYQFANVPESLKTMWANAQGRAQAKGIRLVMLTSLLSGGHSFNLVTLGENLPNARRTYEGKPLQRTMTFDNTTHLGSFEANRERIQKSMALTDAEMTEMNERRISVLHVMAHEIGHTFDTEPADGFLSKRTHVAELDAEATALYLVSLYSPHDTENIGKLVGCWLPCRRALQSLSSPHSQSDLVMFDEYVKAGAIKITEVDGYACLKVVDQDALEKTAFCMALRARLWQHGIPMEVQQSWLKGVEFDRLNSAQAEAITEDLQGRALTMLQSDSQLEAAWRKQVNDEVEQVFALERMKGIKDMLAPVLERIGDAQPLLFLPGDERLEKLVRF